MVDCENTPRVAAPEKLRVVSILACRGSRLAREETVRGANMASLVTDVEEFGVLHVRLSSGGAWAKGRELVKAWHILVHGILHGA